MDEAMRCDRVALIQRRAHPRHRRAGSDRRRDSDRRCFAVRGSDRYGCCARCARYPHAHSVFPFGDDAALHRRARDVDAPTIASRAARATSRRKGIADAEVEPIAAGHRGQLHGADGRARGGGMTTRAP